MTDIIQFPALGLNIPINPILVKIGPLTIHWYGVIIAAAFLVGTAILSKMSPRFGINSDRSFDVLMGGFLGGIVCARLYYVAFAWNLYKDNPITALYIWQGGLAIYGGLIGGLLVGLLMCKWRRVKSLPMLDAASLGLLAGQAIGRWGNFVNMEAFGTNTNLPWGMTSDTIFAYLKSVSAQLAQQGIVVNPKMPVHPTFLYESVWNVVGLVFILLVVVPKRRYDGQVFLNYVGWYGLGRFWIEGLRTDSLMIGHVRISQAVAGLCALVAYGLLYYIRWIKIERHPESVPPLYCTTAESALALSGELYKKHPAGEPSAEEAAGEDASAAEVPAESASDTEAAGDAGQAQPEPEAPAGESAGPEAPAESAKEE